VARVVVLLLLLVPHQVTIKLAVTLQLRQVLELPVKVAKAAR
jgi:hypothetical protein